MTPDKIRNCNWTFVNKIIVNNTDIQSKKLEIKLGVLNYHLY